MRTRWSWRRRTTRWHSALGQTFSWQDYQFAVLWQWLRIFIDWISFLQHTTHIFPYLRISSHCWHIQWPSLCFLMCLSNAASRFWSALVIRPRWDNRSSSSRWQSWISRSRYLKDTTVVSFKFIIEDLDNFTDVEMPALLLKWVGEGREEERVETEDRLVAKRVESQR